MKTLLVLAKNANLAAALRAVVDPLRFRILLKGEIWEAEPLLRPGLIDLVALDADLTSIQPLHVVDRARRLMPGCPILIFAANRSWEWEEEAYLRGVRQVLPMPVRGRLVNALLEQLWPVAAESMSVAPHAAPPAVADERALESSRGMHQTLSILRDFSSVLSHSLCSEALLKQFLLMLREIMGVNRAAIFLRPPPRSLNPVADAGVDRQLHSACAIGLASELLEHFALSLDAGIGGYVVRRGRILRKDSDEALREDEVAKEFELLGAEVAIPVLDRESLVGVALFDSPLTGESFDNETLSLAFHLLEQLGLAIKNSWLYDQLSANHEMMTDILSQLAGGCVVVGRNLEILHANRAARAIFSQREGYVLALDFCELPQVLGGKVYDVLKTGTAVAPFKFVPQAGGEASYRVTITPFQRRNANLPSAVLLLIEDITQEERGQALEIESANLRLMAGMSEHLAHEIGNALVPLSTHHQLMIERWEDPDFRLSLNATLGEGVQRIGRLARQMLYLSREKYEKGEAIPAQQLIAEAFAAAQAHFAPKTARLVFDPGSEVLTLSGERTALKHALSEILLNAIQASPDAPEARVRVSRQGQAPAQSIQIEVHDTGPGFTVETLHKAQQPFYSTRNVGVGLGLTVSRRIIEGHQGKIEVAPGGVNHHGVVRISLPLRIRPVGGNGSNGETAMSL